jgi:hypothetical protein
MIDSFRKPHTRWEPIKGWRVADRTEAANDPMVGHGDYLLPWNRLPSSVDTGSVETLRIFTAEATADRGLPRYLRRLTQLTDLVIPPQIVPTLRPEMLPEGLKSLGVRDDLSPRVKPAAFAGGVSFSAVEEVSGSMPLVFEPSTFPYLRFVHLHLDRTRKMLARLGSLPKLTALGLRPFNDPVIFGSIEAMRLSWLALYGTWKAQTLEGIERLGRLEALRIFEFPGLTSLEPLEQLPELRALELSWCDKIASFDPLLRIPRLERVEFYCCDMDRVAAIVPALEAKGVSVHPASGAGAEADFATEGFGSTQSKNNDRARPQPSGVWE